MEQLRCCLLGQSTTNNNQRQLLEATKALSKQNDNYWHQNVVVSVTFALWGITYGWVPRHKSSNGKLPSSIDSFNEVVRWEMID